MALVRAERDRLLAGRGALGKGLMTMACSAVLDSAFGELGQNHVEI